MASYRLAAAAACGLLLLACAQTAAAQTPAAQALAAAPASDPAPAPAAVAAPAPTPPAPCCVIPAGTLIVIEIAEPLDAQTAGAGASFDLRLAQPIVVDGRVVVPAGARGMGEIIDVKAPGAGGRAARLVLAARYVESGGVRIPLQSFKIGGGGGGAGKDKTRDAMTTGLVLAEVVPAAGVLVFAMEGGDVKYPVGTPATAKVSTEIRVPPPADAPAQPPAAQTSPTPAVAPSAAPGATPAPHS